MAAIFVILMVVWNGLLTLHYINHLAVYNRSMLAIVAANPSLQERTR